MNPGRKLRVLQRELDVRSKRQSRRRQVPARFAVFSILMAPSLLFTGFVLGENPGLRYELRNGFSSDGAGSFEGSKVVEVDGYEVVMVPEDKGEMNGSTIGFNMVSHNQRFFIEQGLDREKTDMVCDHEKIHDLGVKGGDSRGHDWLNVHDDDIDDYTCTKLVEKLEKMGYFQGGDTERPNK